MLQQLNALNSPLSVMYIADNPLMLLLHQGVLIYSVVGS